MVSPCWECSRLSVFVLARRIWNPFAFLLGVYFRFHAGAYIIYKYLIYNAYFYLYIYIYIYTHIRIWI